MTSVEGDSNDEKVPGVLGVSNAAGDGVVGRGHRGVAGFSQSARLALGQKPVPAGPAVYGESKGGPGVEGHSDTHHGVYGGSTSGRGVEGRSVTDFGVAGHSRSVAGVRGTSVEAAGAEGRSTTGAGVFGYSEQSAGVVGVGVTSGGSYYADSQPAGVWGRNEGSYGPGVLGTGIQGVRADGDYTGVYATSSHPRFGVGVRAFGSWYGVWASIDGGPGQAAVLADNRGGTAGQFLGDVDITGSVTKAGGGFRIDHPADPANKYLTHSFVESPTRTNLYDGTAVLDDSGSAEVELPAWFEELNTGFRYQLTAVGGPAPELHVGRTVENGRFAIAGGRPGLTVCWQVTGTRQDPWARANPMPVESDKPEHEQGRYLHPELYDQPADLAVGRNPEPEQRLREVQGNAENPRRESSRAGFSGPQEES